MNQRASAIERPSPESFEPMPLDVSAALELVEKVFGINRILDDEGHDRIATYYEQSRPGYEKLHSAAGCMHLALNHDGQFRPSGYLSQARAVGRQMEAIGATRVLEVGCGTGFNLLHLAQKYPDCQFVGLDLLAEHVAAATEKAAALGNVHFVQGSFEPIPDDLGSFDMIFGVETLCYAHDPVAVSASVARALTPRGRFVFFDAHRKGPLDSHPHPMQIATRLYEQSTVVTYGFHQVGAWEDALRGAGLGMVRTKDVTELLFPGMRVLQDKALRFFTDWKLRTAAKAMPHYLLRNAVAGLVGPFLCFGPGPGIDMARSSVSYLRIDASRG